MEDIINQTREEANKIWKEKFENSFNQQINKSYFELLNELKKEIVNFNDSINSHIEKLDEEFNNKWTQKFQNEMSQLEQLKNQNYNNQDNNEFEKNQLGNKFIDDENHLNFINDVENNINNNNKNKNNDNIDNENNNNIIFNNDDNYLEKKFVNFNDDNKDNNLENKKDNNKNNFEKEEDDDEELRKKDIDLNEFNKPPLIYLTLPPNSNPLINIILQCLSNIKWIPGYYLNPVKENKILQKSKDNPNNNYLGPSFLKLLDHLWKSNKKEYSPNEIHDDLKKLMMNNYKTNDAGIILKYILNELHEELLINDINNNPDEDDPFDQYDEKKCLKKYQSIFLQQRTQISDYFYSTIEIKKRCVKCSHSAIFFEASPIVTIYLLGENNNNEMFNKFSLEEHLQYLLISKEEEKINENCFICCNEENKYVNKVLYTSSGVLIININRDKDANNTIYFRYPENFEGQKIINNKLNLPKYELTTVIKKTNNNNFNNLEYIAYFKSFIDQKWYSYNNQTIESIENNYKNIIFDEKNTCVLIYTKIN